jgi:uncharacterized cupredoxin-like copper-binding protein
MHRLTVALMSVLALLLVACGGGGDTRASSPASGATGRTVTATLSDDMAIQLSESDFRVGETVRFRITNAGAVPHEFYLGDAEAQEHHAEEMAEMDMAHDEPNGVSVAPGATETLEYTFEQSGEMLAGCHEPGHYQAGMVTAMTVAEE